MRMRDLKTGHLEELNAGMIKETQRDGEGFGIWAIGAAVGRLPRLWITDATDCHNAAQHSVAPLRETFIPSLATITGPWPMSTYRMCGAGVAKCRRRFGVTAARLTVANIGFPTTVPA